MPFNPIKFAEKYKLALESASKERLEGGLNGFELEWNLLDEQFKPLLTVGSGPAQQSFVDYLRAECLPAWLGQFSQLEVFHWMVEWATRPYFTPRGAIYEARLMEAVLANALARAGAKFGEHLRVDPVRLGPPAAAPREVPHLARIGNGEGDLRGVERSDDGAFPAAGRLADHLHRHAHRPQPGDERRTARRIVGETQGAALEMEVEGGFGDVESGVDGGWIHGRSRLSLVDASSRLRQRFEFKNPKARKFALKDGLQGPRATDELCLTRCGAALTAPQHGVFLTST